MAAVGATRGYADPDPATGSPYALGAQLYEIYCSSCHGIEVVGRGTGLSQFDEVDAAIRYSELRDLALGASPPPPELDDDWPEWAEFPNPNAGRAAAIEAEIQTSMAGVIEQALRSDLTGRDSDISAVPASPGATRGFDPMPGATNLADPTAYFYGTSPQALFNSIAHGTGAAMPGLRTELGSDEAIWEVVDYIRGFWGEEWLY